MPGPGGWGQGNCGTTLVATNPGGCQDYVQCLQDISVTGPAAQADGASEVIEVRPVGTMRPLRFLAISTTGWFITDVSVAMSRFQQGSIPALRYAAAMTDLTVSWGIFDQINPLEVTVLNDTGAPAQFLGVLTCQALIPGPRQ